MSPLPNADVVNRAMLEELIDALGAEGLDAVVDQFEMDALAALDDLEGLIAAPDELRLRRVGHKLKGLFSQVGLDALAAVGADMEVGSGPVLVEGAKTIAANATDAIAAVRTMALELIGSGRG